MEKKGSGSGRSRPFYELPSHVKPCSQIIQETRLQLKYSRRMPAPRDVGVGDVSPLLAKDVNGYDGDDSDVHMRPAAGYGGQVGVRPVNTQRPFTPRDNSASLWGVSARKRPPSAITLSRLSVPIEDSEESTTTWSASSSGSSTSSTLSNTFGSISPSGGGGGRFSSGGRIDRGPEPKSSLGSLSGSLAGIAEGEVDDLVCGDGLNNGRSSVGVGNVEKTRLQMKSLSLQNGETIKDCEDCEADATSHFSNKKARHSGRGDVVGEAGAKGGGGDSRFVSSRPGLENGHNKRVDMPGRPVDPEEEQQQSQHIHNLELAVNYLSSFVKEYVTSDKPPKAEVISILKKIRQALSTGSSFQDGLTSKLRKQLLELIFKLVERNPNDDNILFWSSFVLLHCNIIGNNLTTLFKMVFKSSKSKGYKDVILDTEYLDVLMKSFSQICPKTQTESMIYGYGTLKFLCGDNSVLNRVIDLDLIPIMALHLKILNCEIELCQEGGRVPEGIFNGTFQLTSILRNVVGESRALIAVVQSGLMDELCTTLPWALGDIDVLTNIVRILSVVSMDGVCCQVMYNNEGFCPTVVRLFKQWYDKDDVMVRTMYCLGNLLANADDMRVNLFEEPDSFPSILKVMLHYLDKSPNSPPSVDILIKTTRVMANWILNPFVGSEICDDPSLSNALFDTLQNGRSSQELVLCVMCALNNTSFYINYTELDSGTMKTAEYLFQNLGSQGLEVREETVKVLGNLTRNADVRLMAAEYMENILLSLDEAQASVELLCATCGVLINVVIEERVKAQFLLHGGLDRVTRVLDRIEDMMVSLITCQVIWNLLISHENQGFDLAECISPSQRMQIKNILVDKLGKVQKSRNEAMSATECDNDHGDSVSCTCYSTFQLIREDFMLVAKDIVDKL